MAYAMNRMGQVFEDGVLIAEAADEVPMGGAEGLVNAANHQANLLAALENLLILAEGLSGEDDWQIREARAAVEKARGKR